MEWRCEWCGKPHEENDPPCDNCGHGSFEKAIVQQTDLADSGGPESTTVWVCTECGRTHTKHAPPCSRCGNHKLVKEEQRVDESELTASGYLDLLTPRYALGIVLGVALAVVFVLGLAGIVPLPGMDTGVPDIDDVPGDAESASGVSLGDAEETYLEEVNDERSGVDSPALDRDDHLDDVATFVNQRRVKADYGDGSEVSRDRVDELVSDSCDGTAYVTQLEQSEYGSAQQLGENFASEYVAGGGLTEPTDTVGVDMHAAPDGTVYMTQIAC